MPVVLISLLGWPAWTHAASPATTRATQTDLARYVPSDVLMAYRGRLSSEGETDSHMVMRMLKWVDLARQLNLIPERYRVLSDIAGSLPIVGRYEHVVMLMDVSSKRVGRRGYRLAHMQLAIVLATRGEHQPVADRIRRLLGTYTDRQFGKIEKTPRGPTESYKLTDARLPGWATWEWGPVGSCYVIGLGPKAFDRVAETYAHPETSLQRDAWFAGARKRCQGREAMIEWLVDYQGISENLSRVVEDRPEGVLKALGAGELRRGLATIRMKGRYLVCYIMNQFEDGDQFVPLSDPDTIAKEHLAAVPSEASCATMRLDLSDWVCRLRDAYLASQTDGERESWSREFAKLERRTGLHVRSQLLDRLGDHLIIHTWPAHPLNLPLTFTLMLEIDHPGAVRDAIDTLMGAWQERQQAATTRRAAKAQAAEARGEPTTRRTRDRFKPRVGREPDGTWYLQAGVVRPAIGVSDRYIVISWSPQAVRANLRRLKQLTSRPTSSPR